jgi:DNA-binding beta-propeller fold protein YncE
MFLAVDAPAHTVYALAHKDDAVLVIDTDVCSGAHRSGCATLVPREIHTGADPESISLDPRTHTLYTANEVDNTVSVIDASRCNARVTWGCRTSPPAAAVPGAGGIAVDPSVHTAYVTSDPNFVAMIDTWSCNAHQTTGCRRPASTVTIGDHPQAVALDDRTHTAYVAGIAADGTGSVSVLDTRTCNAHRSGCAVTAALRVSAGAPTDIAVNALTDTIYVGTATSTGSNVISVFNGATCNAGTTTGCGKPPALMAVGATDGCSFVAVAVDEASNTIYATNTEQCQVPFLGDKVYVYDGATCQAANTTGCGHAPATITAGFNPYGITVDRTTNTVYAALLADGEHAGSVAVINGATCNGSNTSGCTQTPAHAVTGFGPTTVTVDPKTHGVYVTNIEDTSVSVIDGTHCNATDASRCNPANQTKISVDDYPTALAVDPQVGTAYVTSGAKGTISVIPLQPRR